MKQQKRATSISFHPHGNTVDITWYYTVWYKPESDRLSCFVPGFNIFFSAKDEATATEKSKAMTNMYIDHFLVNHKKGFKAFAMQLHKLGFKADNDAFTLKELLHDRLINADFRSAPYIPKDDFSKSQLVEHQSEIVLAD